jgi:hypothetical protein
VEEGKYEEEDGGGEEVERKRDKKIRGIREDR